LRARQVFEELGDILWYWLLGQLAAMGFIGVLTGLGIWLLGMPLALAVAVIAALVNFIPNFGPVIAAIPALLLAVLQGPTTVLLVVLMYTGFHIVQNHLVVPLVQQRAVRLAPVALMLAQMFLYFWDGLLGMALAPPLAAILLRAVQMLYVEDRLHDPMRRDSGFWPEGAEEPPSAGG
jgi:predicted PurR-regulated permease PerM